MQLYIRVSRSHTTNLLILGSLTGIKCVATEQPEQLNAAHPIMELLCSGLRGSRENC
jgi:hypothetical protein